MTLNFVFAVAVAVAIFALLLRFCLACVRLRSEFVRLTLDTTHVRIRFHIWLCADNQYQLRGNGCCCQPAAALFYTTDF